MLGSWRKRKRRLYDKEGRSKKPRKNEQVSIMSDSSSSSSADDENIAEGQHVLFRRDHHLSSALIISEIEYVLKYRDKPAALKREHLSVAGEHRGEENSPPEVGIRLFHPASPSNRKARQECSTRIPQSHGSSTTGDHNIHRRLCRTAEDSDSSSLQRG